MNRAFVTNLLRNTGIIFYTDKIRYYIHYIKKSSECKRFKKENPQVAIPPAYLMYESFGLDYYKYYFDSRESAKWLLDHFKKYKELTGLNILDWGCGPARTVRHLPSLLNNSCSIYGTDYNKDSIAWDKEYIPDVNFNLNGTRPPLPYVNSSFDIIYGISIFTHLPEDLHYEWFNELARVTKNEGIIFLTMHGNAFKQKLSESEKNIFDSGQIVIKGNTKVGHRTYTAYHPEAFVKKLFAGHEVLEHIAGDVKNGRPQQDVWIIKIKK